MNGASVHVCLVEVIVVLVIFRILVLVLIQVRSRGAEGAATRLLRLLTCDVGYVRINVGNVPG